MVIDPCIFGERVRQAVEAGSRGNKLDIRILGTDGIVECGESLRIASAAKVILVANFDPLNGRWLLASVLGSEGSYRCRGIAKDVLFNISG